MKRIKLKRLFKSKDYDPKDVANSVYEDKVVFMGDYHALPNCWFNGPVVIITDKPGEVNTSNCIYVNPVRYVSKKTAKEIIDELVEVK